MNLAFYVGDRNCLGVSLGIGFDLVFVGGLKLVSFFYVRAENDLVLVYGWKLTCFWCGDRN